MCKLYNLKMLYIIKITLSNFYCFSQHILILNSYSIFTIKSYFNMQRVLFRCRLVFLTNNGIYAVVK